MNRNYILKNDIINKITNILDSYGYNFWNNENKNDIFKKVYSIESEKSFFGDFNPNNIIKVKIFDENSFLSISEMIILSIKAILKLNINNFYIHISSKEILDCIVKSDLMCELSLIENLLRNKDFLLIKNKFKRNKDFVSMIENIEKIYNIILLNGFDKYVYFDCSSASIGYKFNFNIDIERCRVLSGGITNNGLLEFDFYITLILKALQGKISFEENKENKKMLIGYSNFNNEIIKRAYEIADKYRQRGIIVENSFIMDSFEKNFEYAKNNNISNILYFIDDENIIISNLDEFNGYTIDAKISDIIL